MNIVKTIGFAYISIMLITISFWVSVIAGAINLLRYLDIIHKGLPWIWVIAPLPTAILLSAILIFIGAVFKVTKESK